MSIEDILARTLLAAGKYPPSPALRELADNLRALGVWPQIAPVDAAPVDAVAATDTLTSNNTNVSDGDYVVVDGRRYTYRADAITAANNDVLIGASADASLTNLARAINNSGGTAGTDYLVESAHPTTSSSTVASHALTFTARTKGVAGNALTLSKSAATLTVGGAVFSGGIDGTPGRAPQMVMYSGQPYLCTVDAEITTSGAWKKMTVGAL